MSIEKRGRSWRVRYRDDAGRNRSKTFALKTDAQTFDREVARRKQLGDLALLEAGKQPLNEFVLEWVSRYAKSNLSPKTLRDYAGVIRFFVCAVDASQHLTGAR